MFNPSMVLFFVALVCAIAPAALGGLMQSMSDEELNRKLNSIISSMQEDAILNVLPRYG
ncbi:hypothetical protein Ciccas_010827, partial [Cichlidogyrus casuarinus]